MALMPTQDVPNPAHSRPDDPWEHSGFGSDSALEAMKRVARTKPAPHNAVPNERPAPSAAAERRAKTVRRARQRAR